MNRSNYKRQVIAGLQALGARDMALLRGGKHPRLSFSYGGQEHRVTLASSPSDVDAVKVKMGDIRRQLGISKRRETMAETIVESAHSSSGPIEAEVAPDLGVEPEHPTVESERPRLTSVAIDAVGSVGYYPGNRCVVFSFPKTIGAYLPGPPNKLAVSPIGLDEWTIHPGEGNGCLREKGGLNVVQVSGRIAAPDLTFFASTPAEYVAVDDHVMVRLMRPPPMREKPRAQTSALGRTLGDTRPTVRPPELSVISVLEAQTTAECRAALEAMRRIYAATPYRLVEAPDGKLFLQAIIE